ncbi:MAG: ABC transporter ATP-binding protein [Methanospirillum sp.]
MSPGEQAAGGEIIRIEHLSKIFKTRERTVTAVNDISFSVHRGEIFGLLGPNGAGKSTLIRILTTLLAASSGEARVGSFDLAREPERVRAIIGVCPQNSTLDLDLSAWDNLEFYGNLVDYPEAELSDRIRTLLASVDLADRAHSKVGTFSGGMRRKLEIVRAFIHRPLIIFLDEPTIGLDPEARREVWDQIARLNAEETTVILTTHYMDEAEKLCNRIAFIDGGRLIALDTMENLKGLIPSGDLIEIGFERITDDVITRIRANPQVGVVEMRGRTLAIQATGGGKLVPAMLQVFEEAELPVTSLSIRSPSLEDIFIYLTGKGFGGGEEATRSPASGRDGA